MKIDPPDAHLRQALRHAPDANVQAPGELSAQILAAAHRAGADSAPRPHTVRRSWWSWGGTWRLGASGALASVLMAGVIGLLWRGESPGPAREDPVAAPATSAAPPWATTSAASSVAPSAAPSVTPATVAEALPQRTPKTQARSEPLPATDVQTTGAPALVVTPPPPAPPAPMPMAAERALAQPAGAAASWSLSGQRAIADLAVTTASAKAFQGAPPWQDAVARGAVPTLLQPGAPRRVDAAWLQALAADTDGRWRSGEAAQAQDDEVLLEWRVGDQALGRLWLGPARALWCPLPGPKATCQTAALSAQTATGLKEKLPR